MEVTLLKLDFESGRLVELEETDTIPIANLPAGASGSFAAQSGEVVTVVNGLITQILAP